MNAETSKNPQSHPILGRYHGFSATGISVAEFSKIVQSLHPIRDENSATPVAAQTSALKIHPKVFSMINCWISDSESPVVTEINLDAVENNLARGSLGGGALCRARANSGFNEEKRNPNYLAGTCGL